MSGKKKSFSLAEGQVFAHHKAIRRKSSVFNPPYKADDDGDDILGNDDVFENSRCDDSRNESKSGDASIAKINFNGKSSESSSAASPAAATAAATAAPNLFLERIKSDPKYSPMAIRRRQSLDCSLSTKHSSSSSSCSTPLKATHPSNLSAVVSSVPSTPGNRGVKGCQSATPKYGAMSPMAVKAISNQMSSQSSSKNPSHAASATKTLPSNSNSNSGKSTNSPLRPPMSVLTPNKSIPRTPPKTGSAGRTSTSTFGSGRNPSTSHDYDSDEENLPTPPSGFKPMRSRRSDSMELTTCSPKLVRTSVSTSDESLLFSKDTPRENDSDMEVVDTTPSSAPK